MRRITLSLMTAFVLAATMLPLAVRADEKDDKIVVVVKIPSDQLDVHGK